MNLFGITSIMIFFASLGFGLFIYSSNRESKVNRSWFIFSVFVALWGLSLYGVTSTLVSSTALKWQYLLDISATMIPVAFFVFVSNMLNLKNSGTKKLIFFIAFILAIFTTTPFFKLGMTTRYDFFWVNPGDYYITLPIFFILIIGASLVLLVRGYFTNKDPIINAQIRNTLLAGVIGSIGGATNFFPQIINIYPFGNYFFLLYIFFMSYGVLKYKLLTKKIISAQLLTGGMVLVLLFNLLKPNTLLNWLVDFILFLLVLIFSILLVKGMYKEVEQREKIEALAKDLEIANKDLGKANDRLKELDQLKSEFLSLATHQIRAPLTAIKGYASLILEGDYGKVTPDAYKAVQVIFNSCQNLVVIVSEFLDISRIEQGRMKYDLVKFDVTKLISDILFELKPTIEKTGLTMEFKPEKESSIIYADQGKIKQVIGNIIDNSVKYTPKGGVTIKIDDTHTKVIISISDTGIGVAPEDISKLFTKFTRAKDAFRTNVIGTGLGLYVAKQMVEAQNGKIWVESPGLGKGSTFYIELPKQ